MAMIITAMMRLMATGIGNDNDDNDDEDCDDDKCDEDFHDYDDDMMLMI